MKELVELIKLSFYRLFMPIAVGISFVTLVAFSKIKIFPTNDNYINIFLKNFSQNGIQVLTIENMELILPGFLLILIFLILCFVIGEIFSILGEMIINLFFSYSPIFPLIRNHLNNNKDITFLMERISPYLDKWLSYKDFVDAIGRENIIEISEVHFVMSRFFAGLMAVSLATIHILVPCIFAIIAFIMTIICRRFKINKILNFAYILILFVSFLELFFLKTSDFKSIKDILGSLLFTFFFFLASIYYRSHANLLNLAIIEDKNVR
ncbi:hypothetical protein [Thermodesulfatator autotrophicus]|uniref:Uncharacterized protein n=1 Tax=Thermodesulfatator autotrophicus TaxID=1795632 RepID=A0A177E539_9BACT|nr:hypothetical protein [Thermodesulfatator autotrophicus]OAG27025.1 hypothetical protein TH606_09090 [Thermodesulfatator autotrophicus]